MRQMSFERLRKMVNEVFLITFKESVYIAILTTLFFFLSFIGHIRSTQTGVDTYAAYYGFPLEWFKQSASFYIAWYTYSKFEILWLGFALDAIIFILSSLIIIRVADRVHDDMAAILKLKQHSSR